MDRRLSSLAYVITADQLTGSVFAQILTLPGSMLVKSIGSIVVRAEEGKLACLTRTWVEVDIYVVKGRSEAALALRLESKKVESGQSTSRKVVTSYCTILSLFI